MALRALPSLLRRSWPVLFLATPSAWWLTSHAQEKTPSTPAVEEKEKEKATEDEEKEKVPGEDAPKAGEKGEDFKPNHKVPKGGPYKIPATSDTFLRAPYLQRSTPTSVDVIWRSPKAVAKPVVRFGATAENLDRTVEGSAIELRRVAEEGGGDNPLHAAPAGACQYEARVTGLEPDTKYFYAVFDGDTPLAAADATRYFRSLPTPGTARDCTFWIVGDSGTGQRPQKAVHTAARNWLAKNNLTLDVYTHVGDMAYNNGKDLEFTDNFFKIYEETMRQTVCFAAMGNHEGHSSNGALGIGPFFDAYACPKEGESGGVPSGTESYYSYDFGRCHFIVLNSHDLDRRDTAAMARWLKEDLSSLKPEKTDWTFAYWHHPPYTKGSHDSDKEIQLIEMRKYIVPILDSHGVDVAFYGHSHIYERSMLVDGAYATPTTALKDPVSKQFVVLDDGDGNPDRDGAYRKSAGINEHEGIVHITAGHGGTKNNAKFGGRLPIMKKVSIENGSVIVHVSGDTLTATMITLEGAERDVFQMVKHGKVTPQRVENPRLRTVRDPIAGRPPTALGEPVPARTTPLRKLAEPWLYMAGEDTIGDAWTKPDYNQSAWKSGLMPFGYNYPSLGTTLGEMKGKYRRVYLRGEFTLESLDDADKLGVLLRWDDGVIAYLNGQEIIRENIAPGASGAGVKTVDGVTKAEKAQFFSFALFRNKLVAGKNVLAIEAHNGSVGSSDFLVDATLVRSE